MGIASSLAKAALAATLVFAPQPGPQTEYTSTPADIAIIGGSAGGGKSVGNFLEIQGNVENPKFKSITFRRQMVDITGDGGILDDAKEFFEPLGATYNQNTHIWRFPSGCTSSYGHLQDAKKDHLRYKSRSWPLIIFEELTEFEEHQFWYLLSRNRSKCGIRPYFRASTNPHPGWLADLLMAGGYVDPQTGYAIAEMSGVIRWIIRDQDAVIWFDTEEEAIAEYPKKKPLSFTFIRAKLEDNKILTEADPDYESKLDMLQLVDRERLKEGNWLIGHTAGNVFKDFWFYSVPTMPPHKEIVSIIRYWDLASTEERIKNSGKAANDPDYTVGVLLAKLKNGTYIVLDVKRIRGTPLTIESAIIRTADQDNAVYGSVRVGIELDVGQAAVYQADKYKEKMRGYNLKIYSTDRKSKIARAEEASKAAERGQVSYLPGEWVKKFLLELHMFPQGGHDDQVDAFSGAFNALLKSAPVTIGKGWFS